MVGTDFAKSKGFTLIEIAIVMVVVGLLAGGGISILRVMTERKARNDNLEYLQKAKEAILSYADITGRLPWPDTGADGIGDPCPPNLPCVGLLPFIDLNIAPNDAYQRRVKYEINNTPGNLGTNRGTTCSTLRNWNPAAGTRPLLIDIGSAAPYTVAAILISGGPMDADGAGGVFDAIAGAAGGNNITGTPRYIRSTPTTTFDDAVVYIGGYELNSKMACTAGDVCSAGITVQNTGIALSFIRNAGACTNWNPNTPITVLPTDLYEVFTGGGCLPANACVPASAITYSQQVGIDVDRDCSTGFNNGALVDR